MNATVHQTLDLALDAIEQQIQSLTEALSAVDLAPLQQDGVRLRDAVQHLAELAKHPETREALSAPSVQPRLTAIASVLNLHRDNLARLTAFNERQLEVVLPQLVVEGAYGRGTANPARIYRAAG